MPWPSDWHIFRKVALANETVQVKRLAKRLVLIAQVACDQRDFEVAAQILHAAEPLIRSASLTPNDQRNLGHLIIGVHQRLWKARDRHSNELLSASDKPL